MANGTKIGDAYFAVHADTKSAQTTIQQVGTKAKGTATEVGKIGGGFQAVGVAAKTFLAGAVVGAIGKVGAGIDSLVTSSINLNESQNAVRVTFGNNATAVQKLGEEAATSIGLSESAFNSLSVASSAFVEQIAAQAGSSVPEVLDEMTTRVADFASVMNLEVEDAFGKFRSGLAGEAEPLRAFGIDISAAKVEMKALELGLADTATELDEGDKVLARYELIMEQTAKTAGDFANTSDDLANSLRIQAAQIENNRAKAGKALQPFVALRSELELLGAKTLGILATGFSVLTGDITATEGAIQEFEIHTGSAADTLADAVTLNLTYGESFEDLFDSMNLPIDAFEQLTDAEKDHLIQLGYSQEEVEALSKLMAEELVESASEGYENVVALTSGYQENTEAAAEMAAATEEATQTLQEMEAQLRGVNDPIFNVIESTQNVTEAQTAYNDAVEEFGLRSPEAIEAAKGLSDANIDLDLALKDVQDRVAEVGPQYIDQWIEMQTASGANIETVKEILEQLNLVEDFNLTEKILKVRISGGNLIDDAIAGNRQSGGVTFAGGAYTVGEAGRELFMPTVDGVIIPHAATEQIIGGMSGINLNMNIEVGSIASDYDAARLGRVAAESAIRELANAGVTR